MERNELRKMSDESITELIKELKKEQEHRIQVKRAQWRAEISDRITQILELTETLNEMGLQVEFEIEGDGNDRIFNLTNFVMDEHTSLNVVLRPVYKSES